MKTSLAPTSTLIKCYPGVLGFGKGAVRAYLDEHAWLRDNSTTKHIKGTWELHPNGLLYFFLANGGAGLLLAKIEDGHQGYGKYLKFQTTWYQMPFTTTLLMTRIVFPGKTIKLRPDKKYVLSLTQVYWKLVHHHDRDRLIFHKEHLHE